MFAVYAADIRMGGLGLSDPAPGILLDCTDEAERQMIVEWVDKEIGATPTDWGRRMLGGLRLELQIDTLDDDAFIEICRQTDRIEDLVERLLEIGRVEQALAEARQVNDYRLLTAANLFLRHGHADLGRMLIRNVSPAVKTTG